MAIVFYKNIEREKDTIKPVLPNLINHYTNEILSIYNFLIRNKTNIIENNDLNELNAIKAKLFVLEKDMTSIADEFEAELFYNTLKKTKEIIEETEKYIDRKILNEIEKTYEKYISQIELINSKLIEIEDLLRNKIKTNYSEIFKSLKNKFETIENEIKSKFEHIPQQIDNMIKSTKLYFSKIKELIEELNSELIENITLPQEPIKLPFIPQLPQEPEKMPFTPPQLPQEPEKIPFTTTETKKEIIKITENKSLIKNIIILSSIFLMLKLISKK